MLTLNRILIIIVAYKPSEKFLNNLSIESCHYLVVDNSSQSNADIEQHCQNSKNCVYMPLYENTGIASALNKGCQYALDKGFEWVVTMDQDSQMTESILNQMLDFANKFKYLDKTAILSPRHHYQTQTKNYVPDEAAEYNEGPYTMTSGNLLNLNIWNNLNGFNDELFIDMVDTDYYFRAILQGYKIIVLNKLTMEHTLGHLVRKNFLGKQFYVYHHNYIRKYYQIRNILWMIKNYHGKISLWRIYRFLLAIIVTTIIFEDDKRRKIHYMLLGFKDFTHNKLGSLEA